MFLRTKMTFFSKWPPLTVNRNSDLKLFIFYALSKFPVFSAFLLNSLNSRVFSVWQNDNRINGFSFSWPPWKLLQPRSYLQHTHFVPAPCIFHNSAVDLLVILVASFCRRFRWVQNYWANTIQKEVSKNLQFIFLYIPQMFFKVFTKSSNGHLLFFVSLQFGNVI